MKPGSGHLGCGHMGSGHLGVNRLEAAPFDPLSLSPFLWLDASDATTVLTSAPAPATDGQAVATWQDKSGNARHLTQATAASRPVLVEADRLISFDGSNDALHKTGLTFALPFTVVMVLMADTFTVFDTIFQCSTAANVGKVRQNGTTPGIELLTGAVTNSGLTLGDLHILTATFSSTSNQATLRIDEAAATAGTCTADSVNAFILGAADTAAAFNPADVKVGEVFLFSSIPAAEDLTALRAYLRAKWSTP